MLILYLYSPTVWWCEKKKWFKNCVIFVNSEIIEVNQDPLGIQGLRVKKERSIEVNMQIVNRRIMPFVITIRLSVSFCYRTAALDQRTCFVYWLNKIKCGQPKVEWFQYDNGSEIRHRMRYVKFGSNCVTVWLLWHTITNLGDLFYYFTRVMEISERLTHAQNATLFICWTISGSTKLLNCQRPTINV